MMGRIALIAIIVWSLPGTVAGDEPPPSKRIAVTDEYHEVEVTEQYRWLEDWSDPEVQKWSELQNEYARGLLDNLPGVETIRRRVTEIETSVAASYGDVSLRGGRFFALQRQPSMQQPLLITFESLDDVASAAIVVNPNEIDTEGSTTIDWYKPSPDGRFVAVSLSSGGSELGDLTIFDTRTGDAVYEQIPTVNSGTAGGSLAWSPHGGGFFYTRHFKSRPDDPEDQNVFQQVFYHQLGTDPEDDRYELGEGFPEIAEIQLAMNDRTGRLLATVQEGDGGQFAHYLRSLRGGWKQFSSFGDKTVQAVFGPEDDLYLVSLDEAPRGKILRMSCELPDVARAELIVPESEDTIVSSGTAFWGERTVVPTDERLYVVYQLGGPSEIRAFDLQGRPLEAPQQLVVAAVHGLLPLEGDDLLFANTSFIEPDAYYRYRAADDRTIRTSLESRSPLDFSDAVVDRRFATSRDGTRVPLNIIMREGTELDGSNPCIVYGYGGYGVNIEPSFRPLNRLLLDHGVIYVVTNLRGGGEYGEEWHRQGNLVHKQNVFDDFTACVEYMIDEGYTNSDRLAILGGSNGGLLMGATLTQQPHLVEAVVSLVGIYDMLRVELSPNGAFNVTEFGTVHDPDQFEALHAYSPYHNVMDGVEYPAVLFLTGANDPRVDPMQSRKMTARLQYASASGEPVLLRTSANAGHGGGNSLSQRIEQSVEIYAFLFDQLGISVEE